MNKMSCEDALEFAGKSELTGQVLAARWHVAQCESCQSMMDTLWQELLSPTPIRDNVQNWFPLEMSNTLEKAYDHVTAWITQETQEILAFVINPSHGSFELPVQYPASLAGGKQIVAAGEVIGQQMDSMPDGSIEWTLTYLTEADTDKTCTVIMRVSFKDYWQLEGTTIRLVANNQLLQEAVANKNGLAQFYGVPINQLDDLQVVILMD